MAGPAGDVRTMSPQETSQWCNSLALCGVKGRILRDLQEQIQKRQIDGLLFDRMLRSNTLTDLGIEELNARLALAIRRSWSTDFNGVTFIDYAASQAHFQSRMPDDEVRRQKRDFLSQMSVDTALDSEYSRAVDPRGPQSWPSSKVGAREPPNWSPSMGRGGRPPMRGDPMAMERGMVHGGGPRDPRFEDPYPPMEPRVPPPFPGERSYDLDPWERGPPMAMDRRGERGLRGRDDFDMQRMPLGRGSPGLQLPPSPNTRDQYGGYPDPGYSDPGYDDPYDRQPLHLDRDPGRAYGGYPDRGVPYSPEDGRYDRHASRRSPGASDDWGGMGLDQALPKQAPIPGNVARMYAEGGSRGTPPGSRGFRGLEAPEPEVPMPSGPSKGGRANVRDPNAGAEWGGLSLGDVMEPRRPEPRPKVRERNVVQEEAPPTEPPPAAWRGDLFDDGPQGVPPLPRGSPGQREPKSRHTAMEGFRDGPAPDSMDYDEDPPEDHFKDRREHAKDEPPPPMRPAARAQRPPPQDDGWGGRSLGDALAPKQKPATPSGGSTTGCGGSSASSVRSGGKSAPSGASNADPGRSPEWITTWVRSLPESHVPEKTREHLADLITENQLDGRAFSDYVQKVPPEVCAPKHAMKLKAAWSNVLKEAEVAEIAAACGAASRPAQKATMIVV